eukprot:scaffold188368_cov29-Prasinocladus_malaysianus.AAC.1
MWTWDGPQTTATPYTRSALTFVNPLTAQWAGLRVKVLPVALVVRPEGLKAADLGHNSAEQDIAEG